MGVLRVVFQMILGFWLPVTLQRLHRRRLTEERRERAWNFASWGAAVYAFGPLSMMGWLWVTKQDWARWRREGGVAVALGKSVLLLFVGLLASLVLFLVIFLVDRFVGLTQGEPFWLLDS